VAQRRTPQGTRPRAAAPGAGPCALRRTVDAVVIAWDGLVPDGDPVAGLSRRIEQLVGRGADVVVTGRVLDVVELDRRLRCRAPGPGVLLLCARDGAELSLVSRGGPRALRHPFRGHGEGGALRRALVVLGERGTPPALTLVVASRFATPATAAPNGGSAVVLPDVPGLTAVSVGGGVPAGAPPGARHLGGGVETVLLLLDEQLRRREAHRVPGVDADPAWVVVVDADDEVERRNADALFTLSDGMLGTRGACAATQDDGSRLVLAAGVYTGHGPTERLLPGPWWPAATTGRSGGAERRVLDLRGGVLLHERPTSGTVESEGVRELRFASAATPRLLAMRAEGPAGAVVLREPSTSSALDGMGGPHVGGTADPWCRAPDAAGHEVAVLCRDRTGTDGVGTVERLATYATGPDDTESESELEARLDRAAARGFDALLRGHRRAWAGRWRAADVEIPGHPDLQLAARFALFHLWGLAAGGDEVAIGARGLTGTGYSGHVFWDSDVFVLPALMTLSPRAARAGLGYRLRRLPEAREASRSEGREGARFPWESGRDGQDVTPRSTRRGRDVVPVRTGQQEVHVVADVAWAADRYAGWTGDSAWLHAVGHPLLVETARYWATRCRRDPDGTAHIDGVIGPDEYHVDVDDNAFTNVMARWNLRRGADLLDARDRGSAEAASWRELADRIVDGYDPATGRYEQHRGFYGLEPLTVETLGRVPVAADLVLPAERLAGSQIIKQLDVLMLHHLVPDEVAPGSLGANLDFYGPRTAHGSSLSPAIAAGLLARAGRHDEAVRMLRLALRIDLDDLTGATPAGLHVAAQGGAWQALVHGFAGLQVRDGALRVDPSVPADWGRFRLRLRCLGRRVRLEVEPGRARLHSDGPLRLWDGRGRRIVAGDVDLVPGEHGWTTGRPGG
jgi:trehalose/maltose hydrolase-like predicted phosphorylase